ncbi:hypothetical protein [Exiguobacterium sp. JLM-2]|uniref:hypothetical protein n=1 Tax=Exiguobacterium sp. JLM-2 TaxID=1647415 RepID=UPI00064A5597|nr:hypothetical protein [Exiguobacterium sp. JLM-2]
MKSLKWLMALALAFTFLVCTSALTEAAGKPSVSSLQKELNALKKQNATLKKDVSNLKTKLKAVEKTKNQFSAQVVKYKKYANGVTTKSGVVRDIRVTENSAAIYLDGQRLLPTMGNGNAPRTFMFENQLYAPIGPVGQSLLGGQKLFEWNKDKNAMYFGIAPQGKVIPLTSLDPSEDLGLEILDQNSKFNFEVMGETYYPTNAFFGGYGYAVRYKLDGNYQSLKGILAMPQDSLDEREESSLEFSSLDSRGNPTLIQSFDIKSGDSFKNVDIDLSGVQHLEIKIKNDPSVFFNITLESLLD